MSIFPYIARLPAALSRVTKVIFVLILNVTDSSLFEAESRPVYPLMLAQKLENPVWFFPESDLFWACNLLLQPCNMLQKQEISSMVSVSVQVRSVLICFSANFGILIASNDRICPSGIVRTKNITKV